MGIYWNWVLIGKGCYKGSEKGLVWFLPRKQNAHVNIPFLMLLHAQFVCHHHNIGQIMSVYPFIWTADELKAPPQNRWPISFNISRLDDERFRKKMERRHPGTRWDTANINDDNVASFWWLGLPHPDFPRYFFHFRRAQAKRWFHPIAESNSDSGRSDAFLKSEYVRLTGEAVLSLQRREGPFAPPENVWDSPEDAEARAIWEEMAKRVKQRENI